MKVRIGITAIVVYNWCKSYRSISSWNTRGRVSAIWYNCLLYDFTPCTWHSEHRREYWPCMPWLIWLMISWWMQNLINSSWKIGSGLQLSILYLSKPSLQTPITKKAWPLAPLLLLRWSRLLSSQLYSLVYGNDSELIKNGLHFLQRRHFNLCYVYINPL